MSALSGAGAPSTVAPEPGFADPVIDAQRVFRSLLAAMSAPGRIESLSQAVPDLAPLNRGAMALALAILDADTPTWIDRRGPAIDAHLRFHTGCPLVTDRTAAAFALVTEPVSLKGFEGFRLGTPEYPDRSATLILQVERLHADGVTLRGPGIETLRRLGAAPLPDDFWNWARRNNALYPLGVDLIFVTADSLAAVPRSTAIEET